MNPYLNTFSSHDQRNYVVQFFRACAIIAVVMIHTTPLGDSQVYCRPFINFGVATFLFLSGYLTKVENKDWPAFYKKRIIRVLVPYLIWTVLYTVPALLHGQGGVKLINSLLTASAAPHLYYIFVYIQFSLLTPLLGKLAKSRYQFIGWLIAPISVLFFHYFLSLRSPNGLFRVFWDNACLGWFSFYYLGLILGNRILVKEYSLKILITLYVLSLLIQMGEAYGWKIMGVINCGSQLNITALLSSSLFCLIAYTVLEQKKLNVTNKIALFIKKLGDYSFGIYLSHIMILNVLWNYRNVLPYPLNSLTILLLSLFLCYIGTIVLGRKKSRLLGLQ